MNSPQPLHTPRHDMPERSVDTDFSPARIIEVELAKPLQRLDLDGQYHRVWILVRLFTEPIGVCRATLTADGLSPDELAAVIWLELKESLVARFVTAELTAPASLAAEGLKVDVNKWPFLCNRSVILMKAPFISVVICTRDRPAMLAKCLTSLERQQYQRFEVVVVDNAPTSNAVQELVKSRLGGATAIRYCVEPRPGLSWARNAGVADAISEIIAFLDDDDEPDQYWLAGIAAGFAGNENIGCVTGMILPASLDTEAEVLFEEIGGHCKGRGFDREIFSRIGSQSPLFPLPPFGTGANMAFKRAVLDNIGGFDVSLGAGTPTAAGEDTLALTLTMLAGYDIAYEPSALMWHHHRQDLGSLNRQLHGYSIGLTAFYTALLRHRPGMLPALLKLFPAAVGYMKDRKSASDGPSDLSEKLNRRHLQGMFMGPLAYAHSFGRQWRASR